MNMTSVVNDQRGMTGLETAIILIAFVTVAAVFGYAVLSAGLFSAERGKDTVYAGLSEAKSNMELVGSVMGKSSDEANLSSISFSLRNAIAGAAIDLTPCDGTPSAVNKCVISLTTDKDYLSNIKWTRQVIGPTNSNNLLEPGEQFEITIDLTDLGDNLSLSENLSANDKFTLQVKPAVGATVSIQRTLPASIGAIMDLDLGASFGGGTGSSSGGSAQAYNITCYGAGYNASNSGYIDTLFVNIMNDGDSPIYLDLPDFTITSDDGTHQPTAWKASYGPTTINPGEMATMNFNLSSGRTTYPALDLNPGETFTVRTLDTLDTIRTLPDPLVLGSSESL